MKIILCDDNKPYLNMITEIMKIYASAYDSDVLSFTNGADLMEYCRYNHFDIVYMDIEVGKNNGLDMAKVLKDINPKSLVIYMSAYNCYYTAMVNAEPFRFITKECANNQIQKDLADSLDAAVKRIEGKDGWSYTYNKKHYFILFSKIMCLYSFGRKVHIVATDKLEQNYFYGKIDSVEKELDRENQFARINQRVVVNMIHTYYKGPNKVEINRKTYTVSPLYKEIFYEKYKKYGKLKI